ncbi:MAG: tRNA lysidine(34) synthetase TilS [Crocinitomicaceae bacterium]
MEKVRHKIDTLFGDQKPKFLVACSGGPDSIFLVLTFRKLELDFMVAHCNFHLRGEASDLDEKFVRELAKELNIPILVQHFDTEKIAKQNKESIQITARKLRYDWFESILLEKNLDYICTAHHLDDRIETFFLNLFRGTGLRGFAPLESLKGNRFRPLTEYTKKEILDFLNSNQILFREDASNHSRKYERNKLRLDFLPDLETFFPEYRTRFQENFDRIEIVKRYTEKQSKIFIDSHFCPNKDAWKFPICSVNEELHQYWILDYFGGNFNQLREIKKIVSSQKGKTFQVGDFTVTRESDHLFISARTKNNQNFIIESIPFENAIVDLQIIHSISSFEDHAIYIDLDLVSLPLEIRNWQHGDRFQPLGMKGQKLVSDYLTDKKIASNERNKILVLIQNQVVLGILGFCCDENYKIHSRKSNILKIKLKDS